MRRCVPVMVVRVPSISAGLAASTVTPGSTAPEASRTTPAMPLALCASAASGRANQASASHTPA